MSTDTAFFDVLGLPAHADARAVRRAYATLLKRIDAAADPGAFARLREAYEAAMAYCAVESPEPAKDHASAPAPASEAACAPAQDIPDRPVAEASPEDDLAHTLRLADGFAHAAQRVSPGQVRTLLVNTIGNLRLGYIDAPGRFEERMIELLMTGAVSHRDVLFNALAEELHWNEIGRLAPLGERGRWVEAVLAQEVAWRQVLLKKRAPILELLKEAEASLGNDLVPLWARVRGALEEFPEYLGLFLRHARAAEWRARYDAMDAARAAAMPDIDAPRAHRPKAAPSARPFAGVGIVIFVLFQVGRAVTDHNAVPHASPSMGSSYTAPVAQPHSPHRASVPPGLSTEEAKCAALYARMDRADAFAGLASEEIDTLKALGTNCARDGYWHPPER